MNRILKVIKLVAKVNLLKSVYYTSIFKTKILVGKNVKFVFRKGSMIHGTGVLKVGVDYFGPSNSTVLELGQLAMLEVSGTVDIKKGCNIYLAPKARLSIGSGTFFNQNCVVRVNSLMTFGNRCSIAWGVNIIDSDEHRLEIGGRASKDTSPIKLKDDVWVGCNSIILKGVTLNDGCVIAAGSVVTKDVPKNFMVGGVPAKVITRNVKRID